MGRKSAEGAISGAILRLLTTQWYPMALKTRAWGVHVSIPYIFILHVTRGKSTHGPDKRPVLDVYKQQRNKSSPLVAARAREGTDEEVTVLYSRSARRQDDRRDEGDGLQGETGCGRHFEERLIGGREKG